MKSRINASQKPQDKEIILNDENITLIANDTSNDGIMNRLITGVIGRKIKAWVKYRNMYKKLYSTKYTADHKGHQNALLLAIWYEYNEAYEELATKYPQS